jgi:hypothetical protein
VSGSFIIARYVCHPSPRLPLGSTQQQRCYLPFKRASGLFRYGRAPANVSSPANFGRTSTLLRSRLAVTPSTTARQQDSW